MLITLAESWGQVLNETERESWRKKAREERKIGRLAISYQPSGYQLFCSRNMIRSVVGLGMATRPEFGMLPFYYSNFRVEIVVGGGAVECELEGWGSGDEPDFGQFFRAGPYKSAGRTALACEYRLKSVERPIDVFTDSTVIAGKYYWYRARGGRDCGVVGNLFQTQVLAA